VIGYEYRRETNTARGAREGGLGLDLFYLAYQLVANGVATMRLLCSGLPLGLGRGRHGWGGILVSDSKHRAEERKLRAKRPKRTPSAMRSPRRRHETRARAKGKRKDRRRLFGARKVSATERVAGLRRPGDSGMWWEGVARASRVFPPETSLCGIHDCGGRADWRRYRMEGRAV
jgi:hypothetical protein